MNNYKAVCHQHQGVLTRSKARENIQNKRKRSETEESEIAETEQMTLETNPLKIESVVEKILGFLDVNSIKAARQLNELWSVEGAKVLLAKSYIKIPSKILNGKSSTKKKTLTKFKSFLSYKSIDASIIPKIVITSAADFEVWKSLGVLGPQVNSIKLTDIDDKGELLQNLLDLLPNLKYLNLNDEPYLFKGFDIMKILTSAMSKPEKDGNPLVVSDMCLRPDSFGELGSLETFSQCSNIKIENLRFGISRELLLLGNSQSAARIASSISKFLSTSQNTLEMLDCGFCESFLSLILFPRMTKLTTVALSFIKVFPSRESRFSPCFRFSEKVPNLDYLIINLKHKHAGSNYLQSLFEDTGPTYSVKAVTYITASGDPCVDPLFQNFPNIERFWIYQVRHTARMFRSLCDHAGKIKELKISIELHDFIGEVADLDSMLTGFTSETVRRMRKSQELAPYSLEELQELKVNPSILDFKELKRLVILFIGWGDLPKQTLAIAGEYAFSFLPRDTRVIIDLQYYKPTPEGIISSLEEVCKLPNVFLQLP